MAFSIRVTLLSQRTFLKICMQFTENHHGATTHTSHFGRQREGVMARYGAQILLCVLSWLTTYNKAIVNGDDVVHLQGKYGVSIFWPRLKHDWIPNRIVDMYGRNLLSHLFDVIYFPLKSLFGVDFFFVYKLFNATLFSVFLVIVYRVLINKINSTARAHGLRTDFYVEILLVFLILTIFPWKNEVQFVCYQIPALLIFLVLAELFTPIPAASVVVEKRTAATWLPIAAFIGAFSLEAYAAIMLCSVMLYWAIHISSLAKRVESRRPWMMSGWLVGFCIWALFVTVVYSQRPAASDKVSITGQFIAYVFHHANVSHQNKCYYALFAIGLIASILIVVLSAMRTRSEKPGAQGRLVSIKRSDAQGATGASWCLSFAITGLCTIIVTSLISLKTGQNYFSFAMYPWGGFLSIALLFGVVAISSLMISLCQRHFAANALRTFVIVLLVSGAVTKTLDDSQKDFITSEKVLLAYRSIKVHPDAVIDSGLALDAIPMEMRPLPSASSPAWFSSAYSVLFKKYYDMDTSAIFK